MFRANYILTRVLSERLDGVSSRLGFDGRIRFKLEGEKKNTKR